MENKEINPVVAIVIGIVFLGAVVFFGFRLAQPPRPAENSYTPGIPPWKDRKSANYGKIQAPPATGTARAH